MESLCRIIGSIVLKKRFQKINPNKVFKISGAPDMKISARPDNRTRLIKAGYRSDRTLSSTISDDRMFLELDRENNEKQGKHLFQK